MLLDLPAVLLESFTRFEVSDPSELDAASRVTARFPSSNNATTYTLRDRGPAHTPTRGVLSRLSTRLEGDLLFSVVEERLGTQVGILAARTPRGPCSRHYRRLRRWQQCRRCLG